MKHQLWYIHQDGRQYGPITERELLYLARISKLEPDAHVWSVGLPKWQRASDMDGLFQPPPFGQPDAAIDFQIGRAGAAQPAIEASAAKSNEAERPAAIRQAPKGPARRQIAPGERAEPAPTMLASRPMAPRGAVAAARPLPTPDGDPQDHANDNVVKRSEEATRLLAERVTRLEQAIEKEADDRRRLKGAIEGLVDYLAAMPDQEPVPRPARRLTTALEAIAPADTDMIDLRPARPGESDNPPHDEEEHQRGGELPVDATHGELFEVPPQTAEPAGYIRRHWQGEQSLLWSFWVNTLAPALVAAFGVAMIAASGRHSAIWGDVALLTALIGSAPLLVWSCIGLLRAARREQDITGRSFGRTLARVGVFLALLVWLGTPALIRTYPSLLPAPLLSLLDISTDLPAGKKEDRVPSGRLNDPEPSPSAIEPPADQGLPRQSTA